MEKLGFSVVVGLKSIALLKKMNPFLRHFRNSFAKGLLETKTSLITVSKVARN